MKTRIRGYLGEQSFEITEGFEHLEGIAEALVFGAVYRTERDQESFRAEPYEARQRAMEAAKAFRLMRRE